MNLSRLELLIGKNYLEKIKNLKILIVGIGGVGGYTFESLVRSGVENITIIDNDTIDETNLNRQIITNTTNIGNPKVLEAEKRAKLINPNINIKTYKLFLNIDNIDEAITDEYDYVVDACDTIDIKALIIKKCYKKNIKFISSMGTANKIDATKLSINSLDKTSYCHLAKKLRKLVSKEEAKYTNVVYSKEESRKINGLGSTSYLPAIAGLLITNYIINDILKKEI